MIRVIALTQFLFIALGSLAVILMMHSRTIPLELSHSLRGFLSKHSLWMLVIPIVWRVVVGVVLTQTDNSPAATTGARASGIALLVAIIAVYGWLIFSA